MERLKQLPTRIKSIDEDAREITFIMSSEDVDRDNDIIRVDGWELDNFMKNPVFLVFHDDRQFPIGRVREAYGEKKHLIGVVRFANAGTYPTADIAYELYKQEIMNAVSVRFQGKEFEPNEYGGYTFKRHELFELSAVPIPANPAALAIGKSLHAEIDCLFGGQEQAEAEPDQRAKEAAGLLNTTINRLEEILYGSNRT